MSLEFYLPETRGWRLAALEPETAFELLGPHEKMVVNFLLYMYNSYTMLYIVLS